LAFELRLLQGLDGRQVAVLSKIRHGFALFATQQLFRLAGRQLSGQGTDKSPLLSLFIENNAGIPPPKGAGHLFTAESEAGNDADAGNRDPAASSHFRRCLR